MVIDGVIIFVSAFVIGFAAGILWKGGIEIEFKD